MTKCPYCKKRIEEAIHKKWVKEWNDGDGDYPAYIDFVCPECGGGIGVYAEMQPAFLAEKLILAQS